MASSTIDPGKGLLVSTRASSVVPSPISSDPDNRKHHDSTQQTALELFQLLIGIVTPQSLSRDYVSSGTKSVPSTNIGLYHRAREQERSSRIQYICTSFISNTLYMLQILLAATFTGLSAFKDASPVTLTVLGAINTVLAGCLAWQKGQGVPQRYRKAQDQYQALILEIEMAERSFLDADFASHIGDGKCPTLDPHAQLDRLQKLYDEARADQQANYPDLYVSTGTTTAKNSKDLAKQLGDAKGEAAKVQSELVGRIESLMGRLEGKVGARVEEVA